MQVLVCIDDTDDLTKSTSTGKIAGAIEKRLLEKSLIDKSLGITRHQLLLDDRIAYTSHNSSMCIEAKIDKYAENLSNSELKRLEQAIAIISIETILDLKADECDPGLCICFPEKMVNIEKLIDFGLKGQKEVLTKDMAYQLAEEENIYLTEHGGDGSGIIGALCGVGLRLSGYDGWFRGKLEASDIGLDGERVPAKLLTEKLGIPIIKDGEGTSVSGNELIDVSKGIKPLLWNHRKAIAIRIKENSNRANGEYEICSKKTLTNAASLLAITCDDFVYDNDEEEFADKEPNRKSCFNCLYRRWTKDTFICIKGKIKHNI